MFNFYSFAGLICRFFLKLYFRFIVDGISNIENFSGGGILISNHRSYFDPVVLGIFCNKKKLYFMAKKELFSVPVLKLIIKKLGAFPVDRKKNSSRAIDVAVQLIKKGELVAMFPQGHRCDILELPPKTGFVRIAIKSGCSIIPCSVRYCGFLPRSKVYITFSKAINICELSGKNGETCELDYKSIKNLSSKIWQEVVFSYNKKGAF